MPRFPFGVLHQFLIADQRVSWTVRFRVGFVLRSRGGMSQYRFVATSCVFLLDRFAADGLVPPPPSVRAVETSCSSSSWEAACRLARAFTSRAPCSRSLSGGRCDFCWSVRAPFPFRHVALAQLRLILPPDLHLISEAHDSQLVIQLPNKVDQNSNPSVPQDPPRNCIRCSFR